jgi:hypothetical protein
VVLVVAGARRALAQERLGGARDTLAMLIAMGETARGAWHLRWKVSGEVASGPWHSGSFGGSGGGDAGVWLHREGIGHVGPRPLKGERTAEAGDRT